jgi:uncharacterized membrane protein YozB (DUF420 family)
MSLQTPTGFSQQHAWDRNFFLLSVVVIWIVILLGFVPPIIRHIAGGEPYPVIVHVHAVAFVGWLVLLSVQIGLIRRRLYDIHRKLGYFGAVLAVTMLVFGPWAGIVAEQVHFGTPQGDPPFLSIEFLEMIAFILQVGAAIWLRRDAAAHKRWMLLAVLFLTTAGFGRWLYDPLRAMFGDGFLPFLFEFYGGSILLVLALGAYDIVTRHRLHPSYIAGAGIGFASQVLAAWLYFSPAWKALSLRIIGH